MGEGIRQCKTEKGGKRGEMGGEDEREGEKRSERKAVITISNRKRDKIVIDFI